MILFGILKQHHHQLKYFNKYFNLLNNKIKLDLNFNQIRRLAINQLNNDLLFKLNKNTTFYLLNTEKQKREIKLKYSFGYQNYSHRRHIRPPGHHLTHYLHFFLIIIGTYAIFYLTNVTEFEDRWVQPLNNNQLNEINRYQNQQEKEKQLNLFSNLKASNNLNSNQIHLNNSNQDFVEDKNDEKEKKSKISFRDKKKIAYENRIRSYSTPDKIFRYFATLKIFNDENPDGIIYMTPEDFLRSITPGLKQPDGLELDKFTRIDYRNSSPDRIEHLNNLINKNNLKIFEFIGDKSYLISYSDFIFLLTLLSTPRRYFEIAFKMFDFDGNENFDFDEFSKLNNLIRLQTTIGQKHRDHSTTGNILKDNSQLNKFFFGENLDQLLSFEKFLLFYDKLQEDILLLEFNNHSKNNLMSEYDFASSLLTYSGLSEKKVKKVLKRIKKIYSNNPKGISFEDYKNFNKFLQNIHDIDIALTFYHIAGGSIDKQIFEHVAKIVNHIDLNKHLVDVVFNIFDSNQDHLLSYHEFIQLMKNRLERGLQKPKDTEFIKLFSTIINCAKQTFIH